MVSERKAWELLPVDKLFLVSEHTSSRRIRSMEIKLRNAKDFPVADEKK
jgi:hypothetical protein